MRLDPGPRDLAESPLVGVEMRFTAFAFGVLMLLAACGKKQPASVDPKIEENIRKYTTAINAYKAEASTSASEARRMSQIADNFLADFKRIDSSVTGFNDNIATSSNQLGLAAGQLEELARFTPPDESDRKRLESMLGTHYVTLRYNLDRASMGIKDAAYFMQSASTYLERSYGSLAQSVRQFQNEILVTSTRMQDTVQRY